MNHIRRSGPGIWRGGIILLLIFSSLLPQSSARAAGGTITGTVRDIHGNGVGGVLVLSDNGAPNHSGIRTATTAENGSYQLEGVLPGANHLRASKAGSAYSHYWNFMVADGGRYGNVHFTIRPGGGSISGRVMNAQGQGMSNAVINVWQKTDQGMNNGAWVSTLTDAGGYYRTGSIDNGLPSGQFLVTASLGTTVSRDNVPVAAGSETGDVHLTFISGNGSVAGRVVHAANGTPVSGANVLADSGVLQSATTTNANGDYVVSGLPSGTYNVVITKAGLATVHRYDVIVSDGSQTPGVNFKMSSTMGIVSGRVFNGDGRPLAGVGILADSNDGEGYGWGITDGNGYFQLNNLLPMKYVIHADGHGYAKAYRETVVVDGSNSSGLDFVLRQASGGISGRVTKDGQAAAYAGVYVNSSGSGSSFYGHTVTDGNGYYKVSDLPSGEYDVHIAGVQGYPNLVRFRVPVGSGTTSGIDLNLRRGGSRIFGVVRDNRGHPLPGAVVQAFLTQSPGTWAKVTTDQEGRYSIDQMWAGKYNFYVTSPGFDMVIKEYVEVFDGQSNQVDIVMGGPPALVVFPEVLHVLVDEETQDPRGLVVKASTGDATSWTAETKVDWLSLGKNGDRKVVSGQTGEILYMYFDPSSVDYGQVKGQVVITSNDAESTQVEVVMHKTREVSRVYMPVSIKR